MPKKLWQKLKYLKNEKYFWDGIKSIFHQFSRSFNEANNTIFFFFLKKGVWLSVVLMWFLAEYKEKFIICQSDDSIYSKLRIFPLFWSHTWKYNIQPNGSSAKVKKKLSIIQFDVFNLSFIFFIPMSQTTSVINRSGACYFLHASN